MHSFKANKDLFISAPSSLVCLLPSIVSQALSLPAKSMKLILDKGSSHIFNVICSIACDLDESILALVIPVVLSPKPNDTIDIKSGTLDTLFSLNPTMQTFY
jgi:hypothetical protein